MMNKFDEWRYGAWPGEEEEENEPLRCEWCGGSGRTFFFDTICKRCGGSGYYEKLEEIK
ncbi:unnamed protein product [marine sediment metagenome]|uniref:Uncharacterized protein n=1 Tax=marine sediment metagenome TaxID=412755 RepID=X0XYJ6_9ZZZZ